MLKGIDPLLTPALLHALAEMGHADEIVIADANFTAASLARANVRGHCVLIELPGATVEQTARAVLSLLPLDAVASPVAYMQVENTPDGYQSAQQRAVIAMLVDGGHVRADQCRPIERFAFYERVRGASVIVRTGDLQPYGNFLFAKGVIGAPLVP